MDIGKPWKILKEKGKVQHAATWFDLTQKHFVALLESLDEVSSTASTTSSKSGSSVKSRHGETEEFLLRIYSIPSEKMERSFLSSSRKISISLPRSLATETSGPDAPSRRIPHLVKFSLDAKLVALQMTKTKVRIVPVEDKNQHVKHWSIEMASGDPNPISIAPDNESKLHYAYKTIDEKVLSGGIIWSDHGGTSRFGGSYESRSLLLQSLSHSESNVHDALILSSRRFGFLVGPHLTSSCDWLAWSGY